MSEVVYHSQHMKHFNYAHLPAHLQAISRPFAELAYDMCCRMQDTEERKMMLRKLLEAKDCAVRAFLDAPKAENDYSAALDKKFGLVEEIKPTVPDNVIENAVTPEA